MLRQLSRLTVGYGIYLVCSAVFMLQVRAALERAVGGEVLFKLLQLAFFALVVFTLFVVYQKNVAHSHILGVVLVYFAAWVLAVNQRFFTEQTHVFTYGLLGFLAARDLARAKAPVGRRMWASALWVALVSGADEFLQGILPYRVGDVRDFWTDVAGGLLGAALGVVIQTGLPAAVSRGLKRSARSEGRI